MPAGQPPPPPNTPSQPMSGTEALALTAAMNLLAVQVSGLASIILQNALTGGRPGGGPAGGSPGGPGGVPASGGPDDGGMSATAGGKGAKGKGAGGGAGAAGAAVLVGLVAGGLHKLMSVLSPLTNLLGQSTSGFSLFNKAASLFATAIAPVLMPAFFLMAVAAASASEVIFNDLMPVMEEWTQILIKGVLPELIKLAKALAVVTDTLSKFGVGLGKDVKGDGKGASTALNVLDVTAKSGVLGGGPAAFAWFRSMAPGDKGGKGDKAVGSAMADTLAELRLMTQSVPVSAGGSAAAYTRAQTGVLNQSPFERRMQDMMSKVVGMMEKSAKGAQGGTGVFTESKAGGKPR